MAEQLLAAFSFQHWFSGAWHELTHYFNHLSTNQWGIISASSVAFGFLCLKGHRIK